MLSEVPYLKPFVSKVFFFDRQYFLSFRVSIICLPAETYFFLLRLCDYGTKASC